MFFENELNRKAAEVKYSTLISSVGFIGRSKRRLEYHWSKKLVEHYLEELLTSPQILITKIIMLLISFLLASIILSS